MRADLRQILVLNLIALGLATIQAGLGAYIDYKQFGSFSLFAPGEVLFYVPALLMFIVRNRTVSYAFCAIYLLLTVQMVFQARGIYLGTYVETDIQCGTWSYTAVYFLCVSFVCLIFYGMIVLVLCIARLVTWLANKSDNSNT